MAKCIIPVVSPFEVYDSGQEIGVFCRQWDIHLPIYYQGSIEDTYSLAKSIRATLHALYTSDLKPPKDLDSFVAELSRDTTRPREEYLTDLRLYFLHGSPSNCAECRFLNEDGTCKHTLPGFTCNPFDSPCVCGIRKEQNNENIPDNK